MSGKPINLHYFKSRRGLPNFGDELAPLTVSYVTGRPCVLSSRWSCELTGIGSILDRFIQPKGRAIEFAKSLLRSPTKIWGSGLINKADFVPNRFEVLAVRGRLTAEALGLPADAVLGDPALLIGEIFQERSKSFALGVVPHYSDKSHPAVQRYAEAPGVQIVDVNLPPIDVVRQISQCDAVISSSLHGLIVSDALGIPNVRTSFFGELKGGDFKFEDYASAVGRKDISVRPAQDAAAGDQLFGNASDFAYQANIASLSGALKRVLVNAMA